MFSSLFLESKHLLVLQDTWQFNSAMYFGSSVVRTMGMFMLILPFIDKDKLTYKDVITVIVIAVALISKSSIAIPLIFLAAFSYLLSYLFFADKKRRILSIVLALLTLLVSVVLKDNLSIQNVIYSFINKNNASIIIYLSIVSILTSFFVFKNKKIYRFNITLILIFFLIILNPINNIFELFSIYSFVGARALTTYVYTLITVGFIYLIFYIGFITKKIIRRILLSTITIISATGTIYSVSKENEVKIIDRIKILYNSPSVYPNSSIQLGKALEEVYEENGEILNVMTFEGVMLNNMPHFLGAMLRNVSPHSISLSGIGRYGQTPTGDFVGFTAGHQKYFDEFIINPNEETTYALLNLTNEYPINCFVVASDKYDYYFNTMGFELVKETFDSYTGFKYFVYYKGE